MLFYSLFFSFEILLCELIVRFNIYGSLEPTIWMVAFSVVTALCLAWFCSLFKGLIGRVFALVFSAALFLFYAVNLVYHHIFQSCLSVAQVGMGVDAMQSFTAETLIGIRECAGYLFVMILPLLFSIYMLFRARPKNAGFSSKACLVWLAVIALGFGGTRLAIKLQPDKTYGIKEVYGEDFVLSFANKRFGTLTATRLELQKRAFGAGAAKIKSEESSAAGKYDKSLYNVEDIDFAALSRSTQELDYQTLDSYFGSKAPSEKNAFTGKYADYNVISILCESFSPYLIDENRTPTLYKLAQESIQFNNYYSCSDDNTSNSEYSFITGLLPDVSLFVPDGEGFEHFKAYNSCTASKDNYLPYTLGNQFKNKGIKTTFYHNYLASFYNRDLTHGNFGYELCTMNNGLKYSPYWPTSDYDMMQQVMPLMLEKNDKGEIEQFHAYFLSFSGHMAYNFESNTIAASNIELVESLTGQKIERLNSEQEPAEEPLSEGEPQAEELDAAQAELTHEMLDKLTADDTAAIETPADEEGGEAPAASGRYSRETLAYIAGNMELEKALKYMLAELEKADIFDKTLIVLTNDHYPYGLGIGRLSELSDHYLAPDRDWMELNKYKGSLMIWTPSLADEENIEIDYPVCELDILPTVSNMCGFDFDSRLLMGSDVFSDAEHIAVLDDRSFATEKFFYNSDSGRVISFSGEEISEEELDKYIGIVRNKFALSQNMLYSDYYSHVFKRND